jgi:hypothetical protein
VAIALPPALAGGEVMGAEDARTKDSGLPGGSLVLKKELRPLEEASGIDVRERDLLAGDADAVQRAAALAVWAVDNGKVEELLGLIKKLGLTDAGTVALAKIVLALAESSPDAAAAVVAQLLDDRDFKLLKQVLNTAVKVSGCSDVQQAFGEVVAGAAPLLASGKWPVRDGLIFLTVYLCPGALCPYALIPNPSELSCNIFANVSVATPTEGRRRLQDAQTNISQGTCTNVNCTGGGSPKVCCSKCDLDCSGNGCPTNCFSGSSVVDLADGSRKALRDVSVGDSILTVGPDGQAAFQEVLFFSTRSPSEPAKFVRVHTTAGQSLTLTPGHYLYVWPREAALPKDLASSLALWKYVLPEHVRLGDAVPVVSGGKAMSLARVSSVEEVYDVGVFMPHTVSNAIVVDGVVATELTHLVPRWLVGRAGHAVMVRLVHALPQPLQRGLLDLVKVMHPVLRVVRSIGSGAASAV